MRDAMVLVADVALVVVAVGVTVAVGCTPQARAKLADELGKIALEVCVEGESVSVCARKCADEAARREGVAR